MFKAMILFSGLVLFYGGAFAVLSGDNIVIGLMTMLAGAGVVLIENKGLRVS